MRNYATHTTFPLSFQSVDPGHLPRLQSPTTLQPHVALILDLIQKRVNGHSTNWSNQVLKLTDYHISRHVASTFKSLTKCATHQDLNTFLLHRWGITSTTTPSVILILLQNIKACNSYNLTSNRKLLDFYWSQLAKHLVKINRVNITSEPRNIHLRLQTTPGNLNAQIKLLQHID